MFWGLVLEPGKRYTTTVDKSFHVSMAALDCSSVKSEVEILSVILECDGQENILCNLTKQQKLLQSHLDLNFMTGDKVAFSVKGNGIVHLSGYLVPEDDEGFMNMGDYEDMEDEEEEEEEEEKEKNAKGKQKGKRKPDTLQLNEMKTKKLKMSENSDEDSEEDEDEDEDDEDTPTPGLTGDSSDEEEDDESDEEADDDSDEEEDDDSEEEEVPALQAKKQQKTPQSSSKKPQQTPNNKQTPSNKQQQSASKQSASTPLMNGSGPNQQQSNKKSKKKSNQGQETPKTPAQNDVKSKNQKTPSSEAGSPGQQKKKLEGGVIVKDLKEGNGPVAKNGQMVSVYYSGRLKANNKTFDECKRGGPAFRFRLGKGEVIKGWDIGVNGMKVGGIRTITCPPNMAYGQKGSPPQIPPNSALVFQVELKAVN